MSSGQDFSHSSAIRSPGNRPEELPPVSPPSAGFIVQLFVIPALIVMAVVAVWALFGKLADSESDWTQLVDELGSSNEHRRWRAALGLAQLLRNEQISPPRDRLPLAQHPEVIDPLTDLFSKSLAASTPSEDDIAHQEFLARTMGSLDADEKTLLILAEAMKDTHDVEVRKSALMAVASIAGRHFDKSVGYKPAGRGEPETPFSQRKLPLEKPTITDEAVMDQLYRTAQCPDPVLRHLAGFAIGSVGGPKAMDRLRAMLLDSDRFARANAALGLARNGFTDGVPVLIALLEDSLKPFDYNLVAGKTPAEQQLAENNFQAEQPQLVRNSLRAVGELWPSIGAAEKTRLEDVVARIASEFFAPDVRILAAELLKTMEVR